MLNSEINVLFQICFFLCVLNCASLIFYFYQSPFFFIYILKFIKFLRESMLAHVSGGGAEGWKERIPSRLCAVSAEPDAGLNLTNREIMTWAEIKSWCLTDWGAPATPVSTVFPFPVLPWRIVGFKQYVTGAPGWLSWLFASWFWLRSWSHGSWVQALSSALCW